MQTLTILSLLILSVVATPDCYDFSVTSKKTDYLEVLPSLLFYRQVDWLMLESGQNCGFYTYGDVFLKSYDADVSGIYFVFKKGASLTCNLDSTKHDYTNSKWLYANSLNAASDVCGYYVGVANSGSTAKMFQVIRTAADTLKWSVSIFTIFMTTYLLN